MLGRLVLDLRFSGEKFASVFSRGDLSTLNLGGVGGGVGNRNRELCHAFYVFGVL